MYLMKNILKGASKNRFSNLQDSSRVGKHGRLDGTSRFCIRFAEAVFVLSLVAFVLTTGPPFMWMLGTDRDHTQLASLADKAAGSRERFISAQIQPWSVSRAVIEVRPDVFKIDTLVKSEEKIFPRRPPNAQEDADQERWNQAQSLSSGGSYPLGLSSGVKIFVYDLPAKYNLDWLVDNRCRSHLFAAEVAIHENLLSSPIRTLDPDEADFFFMPVYVSCNFSTKTGFPTLSHASEMLESAVALVSHNMPYWNMRQGKDHIFVATHDYGACFHAMEDLAVAMGIPPFLRNSIVLQTFGQKNGHPCQNVDHIQIPPYVLPAKNWPDPKSQRRNILAFFRGKMEIHPKNVSGHLYSRGVRTVIWRKFSRDRRFLIKRKRSDNYKEEMLRSVFCLCPLGWAPWSPRIVESVILGCVPVIIADNIELPYSHVIDWGRISVTVAERDVHKLDKILENVAATNLSMIQSNLWREEVRRALVYSDPLIKGDATWQVFDLLSRRKLVRQGFVALA